MKPILLSLLLLLAARYSSNAQWVTIPDSNFVNWLNTNIPQCMNGNQMDTTCAGVVNRTRVYCDWQGIYDLIGIQYFDNLDTLECSYNFLIGLPTLPRGLTLLFCWSNELTGLPVLPPSLSRLYCSGNKLSSLPQLPSALNILACTDNPLTSLPPLPPWLRILQCSNCLLTSLPALPQFLSYLECGNFPISYNNWLTSLPDLPQSLKVLDCDYLQLTSLPILPQGLDSLYCSYNQLISLPELPLSMSVLDCSNNPNLICLPRLRFVENLDFTNTAITCLPNYMGVYHSTPPLSSLPICDSSNVNGCAFYTESISGRILSETGIPIPGVTVTLSGGHYETTTTLSDGSFSFLVDRDGDYAITPSKNNDLTTNNGITSIDLLQMRAHILGMLPLPSPYKIIAADVDVTRTVTTTDILHTRSMILQMTTTFPNGRLWSFVPSDYVFADMQNPFPFPTTRTYTNLQQSVTGQDFIGIKLGDVNGSWDAGIP